MSVNAMYRNVGRKDGKPGGRILTEDYKVWRRNATNVLEAQEPPKLRGPFLIDITIGKPDQRRRDLDNLAKSVLDLLTSAGVIEDDSLCQRLSIGWGSEPGCIVRVEQRPIVAIARAA